MALRLNHFDTKTKQETGIEEKLENTLAEYLFPGVEFSIGTAYPEATIPEDLQEYKGKTLQFSAGERMFFASNPNIREQLYPNPSDGAAYPLPFTPCRSFHELENVRILIVDDVTGENGGVIANEDARKLVGDCKGLIDRNFALSNNIDKRAFQFRLGIKPQAESRVMRIAKGTLAPAQLEHLGESIFRMGGKVRDGTFRSRFGYDLVLATSSFKGRKGDDVIKPGEYVLSIGLGVKALALYREHSLGTQILVNYPKAVNKEIIPIIKQQAEQLANAQKHIIKLAQRYMKTYERRKALLAKSQENEPNLQADIDKFVVFDNLDSGGEIEETPESDNLAASQKDLLLYSLLKADLANYCQLLEHPKIIAELQEFTRKQWVEIATGRSIKFTSGLAQPSLDLQHDEICIPFLGEGEEIIVTRSPLINSNGVITLKNKHLSEMLDGCVYIHPQTAMDNMQCDFDGDLLAFAPSREFPHLAVEVKEKNLPENRYPDIIKKNKVAYQGSFEQIAISAMENKIGIIANEIQKNVALQCELCAMPQSDKLDYLKQISHHFSRILQKQQQGKLQIPEQMLEEIKQVISTNPTSSNTAQIEHKLHQVKAIFKDCVASLGNELQVAADGAKSALRPNDEIIKYCQAITNYKEVEWLTDKKNPEAFTNRGMKSNGYSPIDLMIRQTNEIFEQHQITARPIEQFRKLYPGIEFSTEQRQFAQEIKDKYNSQVRERIQLEEQQKNEPGPYLTITSPISGKKLKITNLIKFPAAINIDFWRWAKPGLRPSQYLDIRVEARKPTSQMPHTLLVIAKFTNNAKVINIPIGTVSIDSVKEHNVKPGTTIKQGKVEFHFGISDGMIDALKQQTREYVESISKETPLEDKLQLAAAIYDVSHTGESKNYSGLKRAGVTFAVFPDYAIAQLQNLQFTEMRVIGTQFNECAGRNFAGEKVAIKFEDAANPREPQKTTRWVTVEGKKLGIVDARSPNLLSGCEAVASITSPSSTSVIITSLRNPENKIQIDQINRYAFANHNWQGEQTNITLDMQQTDSRKAPVVFAKLGNQVLGVLNKESVGFLQQQLASKGKTIQGLTIAGTVNTAPPSYADIIIDPSSVKFPEHETLNIATVVIINGTVEPKFQAKTEQVLGNMIKRAIARAVENGFERVQFVDISPNPTQKTGETLQKLAGERKDIEIEFIGIKSPEAGMRLLTKLSDIILGVKTAETIGVIEFAASRGKATVSYISETGKFDLCNFPLSQKANRDLQPNR
ncbi:hypothetical protein [Calothrix sp. 336/3]|uniref:hypothetical protein n=1 Tax=Calothrix sp. 336/3 TaxID=1337936 RepID=UPI0004E4011B|nr:hypothetical protein [Calothrix sp. 336/3]AKG21325.1 hypothetical protein IJ00_08445 [Calothrix sp. 336/3]